MMMWECWNHEQGKKGSGDYITSSVNKIIVYELCGELSLFVQRTNMDQNYVHIYNIIYASFINTTPIPRIVRILVPGKNHVTWKSR